MKRKIKNIIIANDAEAFEVIIDTINDRTLRLAKIRKEHFLSSRFLFWEGDDKIVITPFPVEQAIIDQAKFIGYINIENLYPSKIDISLSKAIMEDKVLYNKIKRTIKRNAGVTLSPYCFTKDFSSLVELLRKEGLVFRVDQEPTRSSQWLVKYLGSKVGFRLETQKLMSLKGSIPEFFICTDKEEILKTVSWFYENKKLSVVKAFSGEGGWGVLMIQNLDYSSSEDLEAKLELTLDSDTIWSSGPYVVEEFIPSSKNDQNSPSLEVFVSDKGPRITYLCNQIVDSSGRFIGILMGKTCLKPHLSDHVKRIGKVIAGRYYELGYKGFFDVDFIVSKKGIPFPIETNVRRTGGTHVFDLTKHIFGERWFDKTVALSMDSYHYGDDVLSVKAIMNKLSGLLLPMGKKQEGVIVVAVDSFHPVFSFVIFAASRERALQIHKKMTLVWN